MAVMSVGRGHPLVSNFLHGELVFKGSSGIAMIVAGQIIDRN